MITTFTSHAHKYILSLLLHGADISLPSNPCKDVLNYIINDNSSSTNMEPSLRDTFNLPSSEPLEQLILD
jgi:hypothetical protein